ncbi:C40 family peptidase [Rubellimicrobium sp. CFH 75288]|uniref:C40 family peptidase n=1 Tax=Rubellimicrobium sp. CFH 75288 TaxID=2697034 RepID=UPI001412A65A|nr:NlpC/P60 family protein [Rubellimicrobium sp. CFH 75288]NAZ37141.1 phage tail protein [Rubellimicrobium sp. CFH 75288]
MPPAWVAPYIGLPFAPGGRTREGLDCWGLCALVWSEQFGRDLPPYDGPAWVPGLPAGSVEAAATAYARRFSPVPLAEAEEGDGLLLRVLGAPIHAGLIVAPGWMLHIERGCDSVVERFDGPRWARRVVGCYRWRRN